MFDKHIRLKNYVNLRASNLMTGVYDKIDRQNRHGNIFCVILNIRYKKNN